MISKTNPPQVVFDIIFFETKWNKNNIFIITVLLDSVFVKSEIIKVLVSVISLRIFSVFASLV